MASALAMWLCERPQPQLLSEDVCNWDEISYGTLRMSCFHHVGTSQLMHPTLVS